MTGSDHIKYSERRLEKERRRFHYSSHIPERRSGHKRRNTPFDLYGASERIAMLKLAGDKVLTPFTQN